MKLEFVIKFKKNVLYNKKNRKTFSALNRTNAQKLKGKFFSLLTKR